MPFTEKDDFLFPLFLHPLPAPGLGLAPILDHCIFNKLHNKKFESHNKKNAGTPQNLDFFCNFPAYRRERRFHYFFTIFSSSTFPSSSVTFITYSPCAAYFINILFDRIDIKYNPQDSIPKSRQCILSQLRLLT